MQETTSKSELRQILRDRRRAIGRDQRAAAAVAVAGYLEQLRSVRPHSRAALYLPADGELDTRPLADACRAAGTELYLPVVTGDGVMQFALWEPGSVLRVNRYGIPEPGPQYPLCSATELDIVFMPLVGWDRYGSRLGMGGGFYDRALAGTVEPMRVGLAFECQHVDRLPVDDWDVALDYVATEAALHDCRAAG